MKLEYLWEDGSLPVEGEKVKLRDNITQNDLAQIGCSALWYEKDMRISCLIEGFGYGENSIYSEINAIVFPTSQFVPLSFFERKSE